MGNGCIGGVKWISYQWNSKKISPDIATIPRGENQFSKPAVVDEKIELKKSTNDLHLAAKIGDVAAVVIHLLSGINPFDIDEYDNIPVYYASLYGHLLCSAIILVKMGGLQSLSDADRDHCATNALTLEVKRLFTGDTQPVDILKRDLSPKVPELKPAEEDIEGTMFGDLFQE